MLKKRLKTCVVIHGIGSKIMQKQWDNYQEDFEYATDIVFEDTCDTVVWLMDLLMGISD